MDNFNSEKRERLYVTLMCLIFIGLYIFMIVKGCQEILSKAETEPPLKTVVVPVTTDVRTTTMTTTTSEPTTVTTTTTIPKPESVRYFDVPLSEDLQNHIFKLCESYNVDPAMVIAMIERESNYRASAIGDSGRSFGLMQIQPRWNKERMDKLGCTDLLNPYQNVAVGIDLIAELYETGNSTAWVLMAYNGGPYYATNNISQGLVSDYAKNVMSKTKILNGEIG